MNPSTLAKYREAFKPSRAKDDPTDAELALDLLLRHPERFAPLRPQSSGMRRLMTLIEQRREMVGDKTRFTNRLCNTLKQYYPQALEWFEHIDTVLFCDFITRWPTLSGVKRAHRSTLEALFHAHNCRRPKLIETRLEFIRSATSLTEDPGIVSPCRLHALTLVAQLRTALAAIDVFDREISTVARTLPDFALFEGLPGAGPHLTPRLLAAFGEQRERFRHAAELQKYSGIAPVTERSGKKCWGALALAMSDVPTPDIRGMGRPDNQQIILGRRLPPAAASQRQLIPGCGQGVGIQVDTDSVPMLANTHTVR
ncbi:transposase [Paraburkholderia caledonica]